MQKITPFLWLDNQAEEAARFYTSIFPNSKITAIVPYGDAGPGPKGSAMTVAFELDGQPYTALNGGPHVKFNHAVSFVVHCETQREVDEYWTRLTEGGQEVQCGWLTDKYGLSWQIIPDGLVRMLQDKNPERSKRTMQAMLQMKKIDLDVLERAYNQE